MDASPNGRPRRSLGPGQQARDGCREIHFPHSLACSIGLHPITRASGQFRRVQGDGAGALRRAEFKDTILNNIVDLKEDGTFRLDQTYSTIATGLRMTNDKFAALSAARAARPRNC